MTKATSGREDVEALLGYVLHDRTWQQLEELGFADELAAGRTTPRAVADRVRAFGATYARHRLPPVDLGPGLVRGAEQLHARSLAISAWLARAAGEDPRIKAFRRRHLREQLLSEDAMAAWVAEQDRRARPADWPVSLALAPDDDASYRAAADVQLARVPYVQFTWMEPTATGWVGGRWPVPVGSVLASLAELAGDLHRKWRWREHEAVAWVLSGIEPYVIAIEGQNAKRSSFNRVLGSYDVLSRITIDVDPVVTPEQLAGWWRGVRHQVLTGRYRPMSDRHLALARFGAGRPESTTWEQDRVAWNREVGAEHPDWRYDDRRNYHRDATTGVRRMLFVGVDLSA
jgi:hypothetical protein